MKVFVRLVFGLFAAGTIGIGTIAVIKSLDNQVVVSGQLNAEVGERTVDSGFYDMRIVAYNSATGELLKVDDFADVGVDAGIYKINYDAPAGNTEFYYQLCRSSTPTTEPDGLDRSSLPNRCATNEKPNGVLRVVECPKKATINTGGLFRADSSYVTPTCIDELEETVAAQFDTSNTERTVVATVFGERGPIGPKGDAGEKGADGVDGADGDPASDNQALSFGGSSVLSISNGNSVSLASLLDDTDTLASLSCGIGQVAQWNGSIWICASTGADTDDQTLSIIANVLAIDTGNSVSLSPYLDNTDSQAVSLASNIISISGNASTINLAPYLDNTDAQALSLGGNTLSLVNGGSVNLAGYLDNTDSQDLALTGNTLSLTGDGTTVNLSAYLDNTDVLANLSCTNNQIPKWNGSVWACAADVDTVLNESQVDAYIANNGYLTTEIDGSTTNELQNLTFSSNVLGLTSSGTTFNLSAYLDNTDAQDMTLTGNTLALTGDGTSVSLASYLDNTDAQSISLASNVISISGNASTVNLATYLDNTDSQALSLGGNTLSLVSGGSVSLAPYLDNTDAQDLTLSGSTLSLTGDGTTVSLASFLDNTDVLAGLSCSNNQIPKWNGSVWACAADVDTVLNESQVDAYVANNGYLSTEVDGSITNELQDLTFSSNTIGLTSSGVSFNLSAYLDNTDAQDMSLSGNTLSLTGDGTTVSLASYLDNTDAQSISVSSNVLSISGSAGTVDLSVYLDDTDTQDLSLGGNTLSLVSGGSVSLAPYLDNTDAQDLSLSANTLSLTGDGTTVSLASYLDNTDVLAGLSCSNNQIPKWNGSVWACATDVDTVLNESQVDAYIANNGYLTSEVDGSVTNELQDLTFSSNTLGLTSSGVSFSLAAYLDNTDSQDMSLSGNTLSLTGDGSSVSLASYLDNTDAQAISLASNTISITGNASTIDLSPYLDDTDTQDLSLGGNTLSLVAGGSVSLAAYLDNTDSQDLTLVGNTLSLTGDGTSVSLASYLDNTDSQQLFFTIDAPNGTDPTADSTTDTLTLADGTGITITGNSTTDTITIASVLGTSIDSSEIVDSTITGTDIASSTIANANLVNASATVTAGTGLTGGGVVSLGGTITLNLANDFGASIDSSEITDSTVTTTDIANGTILFADLAQNSCGTNDIIKWNGSAWACATDVDTDTDTDTQDLSLGGNTLSLVAGGSVSLAAYLDNTDAQAISIASDIISITGNASTIDLTPYLDDTDTQDLSLGGNTLSLVAGGSVNLAGYLDNTDSQDLTLTGDTLALTGDGTSVSLASYLDNTDSQQLFFTIDAPNGTDPAADSVTDSLVLADGAGITITGNSTTDTITIASVLGTSVDSSEIVDSTITGTDIAGSTVANANLVNSSATVTAGTGLTGGGTFSLGGTVTLNLANDFGSSIDTGEITNGTITFADLSQNSCGTNDIIKWNGSAWICGTDLDAQDLSLSVNTLSLTSDGTSVSLAGYLDNTDAQALSISTNVISITGNASTIDLTPYLDDTDTQDLSLASDTLSLVAGGSVSLASYLDNTDSQDLTLVGNTLALTGDGTSVSLASYLDNTDSQQLFFTIDSPNGTDPSADSSTDTLAFADGAGIMITGNSTTDTITIASVLGTTIDSSEIVDGTITGTDISDGTVANGDLANSSLTVTAGTGLTGGGAVSLGGTVTLNLANDFGASIDGSEITNGTIAFADLGQNSCGTNDIIKWNGSAWACAADATGGSVNSFETITTTSGTSPVADSSTDTLTLSAGTGVTVTGNSSTDTITLAAVLGTDITSAEIVDGTVANGDLANSSLTVTAGTGLTGGGAVSLGGTVTLNLANDFGASIDSGEITNGTIVATDVAGNVFIELGRATAQTDSSTNSTIFVNKTGVSGNLVQLQAAAVDRFVVGFDGTIDTASVDSTSIVNGSVANVDLANSSVTVTAGSGLANGGSISLGGTATLNIGAGNGITVNADDIAVRVASSADALSGTTSSGSGLEVLATGVSLLQGCSDGQLLKWNETTDVWACGNDIDTDAQQLFFTFNADNGTDPQADGVTDTLNFTSGSGVTITGDSTTDTLTIAAVLGTTIDSSAEIVDGIIANADLVNSSITVVAGAGLTTGGAVSLGGTVTLDVGAGTAITVNGNDVAITADGINYSELSDSLSLDATTTTVLGASNQITNLDSTGDVVFQDNGSAFLTIDDLGGFALTLDATDNPAYTITNAGSSNVNTNLSGTGDFTIQDNGTVVLTVLDNGTLLFKNSADSTTSFAVQNLAGNELFQIDTTNTRVYIGDPTADATGALLVLDTKNSFGDPTGINGSTYYNSALAKFRCFENGAWKDCSNTARTAYFFTEDMMNPVNNDGLTYAVTGAAAANSATAVGSVAGRPGVMQHATGTTTTGNPRAISSATAGILLGNNTLWGYETSVRVPTLSVLAQRYTYRTGFIDSGTAESVDGCYFRYSDAAPQVNANNWEGVCRSNSTETTCNTTIAVVANTWYRLTATVNAAGTSVDFATDGTSRCQIATNIPTGAGRGTAYGTMLLKSLGTTSSTVDVDYLEVRGEFTTATR